MAGECEDIIPAFSLPFELLSLIVVKLPLQKIFQLRCVCRTWNGLFQDRNFLKHLFLSLSQSPMIMCSGFCTPYSKFRAYDIRSRSWHAWTPSIESNYFSRYRVHGEVGGLLLVEDSSLKVEEQGMHLQLVNPAMKWQRKLPSLPPIDKWDPIAIGMGSDSSSKSYKVFVVNMENDERWYAYFFSCDMNSWKVVGPCQGRYLGYIVVDQITFHDGALHSIILTDIIDNQHPYVFDNRLCRFNEQGLCWDTLSVQIPQNLLFEHLVEWQGHLMLVGGHGESDHSRLHGIYIWQLEKGGSWVKSITMPDDIFHHLCGPLCLSDLSDSDIEDNGREFCCQAINQYILITNCIYTISVTKNSIRCNSRHVLCDLFTRVWWEVPEHYGRRLDIGMLLMPKFGLETL